ncbi:MAG: hypothetical protein COS89_00270 [Deltaproteobacteria bacterium CG07_land_8_20_14_0_80_38_7]|nr:MAG: hypothetical protein COS89_00270 [Deltaproteobacteria bacterium CG07_land_8_20_14_0_80_38_7]
MKTKYLKTLLIAFLLTYIASCSKPMMDAQVVEDVRFASEKVSTDKETSYYAARWALKNNSYPVAVEDIDNGRMETSWMPTTSDSHGIMLFSRRELGVNGAYYKLIVNVVHDGDKTRIDVGSKIKSVVSGVKSTGIEERRILREIKTYLRAAEPDITNIGLQE